MVKAKSLLNQVKILLELKLRLRIRNPKFLCLLKLLKVIQGK